MPNLLPPPVVEIYLCDQTGVRIECLDYVTEYEYGLVANDVAPFRLKLPAKFNRNNIHLDNIIEIWRGHGPGTLKIDYCGFLRDWNKGDEDGNDYTELFGFSPNYLLRGRSVKDYAGSAQAEMTDQADDMIKAVAKDQLGSDTTAGRDLTSVGGGFTIQADLSDGQSITKAFAYKNVLIAAQEFAKASSQAGTEVYFDIVPLVSSSVTGALAFQLQTFSDQRGADRTWDSYSPIFIGREWGNFQNGSLLESHADEVNYCYVLGPGEGASREITEVNDTTRINMSIWNRREGTKDARNTVPGDTAARTGEGNTYLDENKPKISLGGQVVETPSFRYGRDWNFGDRVTVSYADYQKDAMINKVFIRRDGSGQESIEARIAIEE